MPRQCAGCGRPIDACMGYVKAGDLLDSHSSIRELCGRCVWIYQWTPDGWLERITMEAFLNEMKKLSDQRAEKEKKDREKERQCQLGKIMRDDPDWRTRWSPPSAGFHELCDRSMLLTSQAYDILVGHPASVIDPELHELAHEAAEALSRLYQVASFKCFEGDKKEE